MKAFGALAMVFVACIGNTGGELVEFRAVALGNEASRSFTSASAEGSYDVTLTRATLSVQGIYLSRVVQSASTERETSCYTSEGYVGELRSNLTIDVLSASPQAFPDTGRGLSERMRAADLWLGRGPINEFTRESAQTAVVTFEGVARSTEGSFPFAGRVTIDANRKEAPSSSALPGSNPICQKRIVDSIATDVRPAQGGVLELTIDARRWFDGISFREIPKDSAGVHVVVDRSDTPTSIQVFNNVRKNNGVYGVYFRN